MQVSKGDFVEIKYVGRIKESGEVFDLNDEEVAKKENIHDPKASYKPIVVCVGKKDVIVGLDEDLEGKETGKEYAVEIPPEKAYGKKDAKLFKLVPQSLFKKEEIQPMPGLQITADGMVGVVKTASGGRILVDFNHPLAGKDITYTYTLTRKVEDNTEKIKSYIKLYLNMDSVKVEVKEGVAEIELDMPEEVQKAVSDNLKERIAALKAIKFVKKEQKAEEKERQKTEKEA